MTILQRSDLEEIKLPGRIIQKVVGKDGASLSAKMTMGFARYSEVAGPMAPHHHAEEIVYILSASGGWMRRGEHEEALGERIELLPGMICHIPELEWHVFEYDAGGHVDIAYFYGQVDNIRPEDMAV